MCRSLIASALLLGLPLLQVPGTTLAQERPRVATVNYPLAYFAERLGGEQIEVLFDVPAERDPAFWRPGLSAITDIQAADLIALNGAGFANWTTKVSLPRSRLVDTSASFSDDYIATQSITHSHGADGEHSHTGTASYTWLDFNQAAAQAAALANAMMRQLPAIENIDANLQDLSDDLASLDQLATQAAKALQNSTIIATHPRYQYFARAHHLDIDALDWDAGETPSDAQWTELAQRVEDSGARILIWESTPATDAKARAAEMGLTSIVFPPLANKPAEGDFVSGMKEALGALNAAAE